MSEDVLNPATGSIFGNYDTASYINVYTSEKVPGAGWGLSVFPWTYAESSLRFGNWVDYRGITGQGLQISGRPLDSVWDEGDLLVHEIGHYLGLYHYFSDNDDPACNSNVTDLVDDTAKIMSDLRHVSGCLVSPAPTVPFCSGSGEIEAFRPPANHMNYASDACKTEFTANQYRRMAALTGEHRPTLGANSVNNTIPQEFLITSSSWMGSESDGFDFDLPVRVKPGATLTIRANTELSFLSGLIVDAGGTLNIEPGSDLLFGPTASLVASGSVSATGMSFSASDLAQGWGGIRFLEGSVGTLTNSIVERVGWANGSSVYAFKANVTLDNTTLRLGDLVGSNTIGLRAYGASGQVLVENGSLIQQHGYRGIFAADGAEVVVRNSTIRDVKTGVWSMTGADVQLHDSVVENVGPGGYGVYSMYFGLARLGEYGVSPPSQNNLIENNVTGDLGAYAYATLEGGSGAEYRNNDILRGSSGVHASALTSSHIQAQYNWWGSANGPNTSYVQSAYSSTVTYCPWLVASGGSPVASCKFGAAKGVGGFQSLTITGDEEGDPLDEAREASRRGESGRVFELAGEVLQSNPDWNVRSRAIPLLVAELRQDDRSPDSDRARALLRASAERGQEMRSVALRGLFVDALVRDDTDAALRFANDLVADGDSEAAVGEALTALALAGAGRYSEGHEALQRAAAGASRAAEPEEALELIRVVLDTGALQLNEGDQRSLDVVVTELIARAPEREMSKVSGDIVPELIASPNPTSLSSTIEIHLPARSELEIELYDVLGRQVAHVASGSLDEGVHRFHLPVSTLAEGAYVLRASVLPENGRGSQVLTRVLSIVR